MPWSIWRGRGLQEDDGPRHARLGFVTAASMARDTCARGLQGWGRRPAFSLGRRQSASTVIGVTTGSTSWRLQEAGSFRTCVGPGEAAAEPARERGIRVVHIRIGIVLSASGGALGQMLLPFKLGVGGILGSGDQYMSWIALDDLSGVVSHVMTDDSVSGPVNAVAPNPVRNREFTKTLGRVLRRPTVIPIPAFGVRALFGEMGDALLLASTRVEPGALRAAGFRFAYPYLEGALRHTLGRG